MKKGIRRYFIILIVIIVCNCDIGGLHQYSDETGRKNIC